MQNSEKIWELVDARKDAYEALSDRVWEIPEICYTEYRSVAEHRRMLEEEGFRITENLAGIPTAIMGEADASPMRSPATASANTMRCPACRRSPASRSRRSSSRAATGTAAGTTCWVRRPSSPQPP